MAKLVFGMNMSLDGYVDYDWFAPDPVLFRYFIEQTRNATGLAALRVPDAALPTTMRAMHHVAVWNWRNHDVSSKPID